MKKVKLRVPEYIDYISNWSQFESSLPSGKVILNKNICGCGCTEYFLQNDKPIILVSPRRELINCKMISDNPRPHRLHYFDRSKKRTDLDVTISKLENYISSETDVPKILVTYDSLPYVIDYLQRTGYLSAFDIIVDEFTCIFTDVRLKGNVELNLIGHLQQLPNNVIYISATPIKDVYIDELQEFNNVHYVELIWSLNRIDQVNIKSQPMLSTSSAISNIIESYNKKGYFQCCKHNGNNTEYSYEAVFFLNNVSDIVSIIKKNNLTPSNTLVICADDNKNKQKLGKVGFCIGHVPNEKNYRKLNKTFTFVTKASFEGVDFYSDCSTTYIFADAKQDSLALDISIDIPQIIGRCRCNCNPFRHEVFYFYKTSGIDDMGRDKAVELVKERLMKTDEQLNSLKGVTNIDLLKKLSDIQRSYMYKKDYVDVQKFPDGSFKAVCNVLAKLADLRAIEIKDMQYKTTYSIINNMQNLGFNTVNSTVLSPKAQYFRKEFMQDGVFARRMKLYCDVVYGDPDVKKEIYALPDIPYVFTSYYDILGPDKIKALRYRDANMEEEIQNRMKSHNVAVELKKRLVPGEFYSNEEVKSAIQDVYDELGITDRAKANEIKRYIPDAMPTSKVDKDGKQHKGYKI